MADPATAPVQPPPPERGNPDKKPGGRQAVIIRENRALELRMAGATYAAIAAALDLADRRSAQRIVERAMKREQEAIAPDREAYVQMHIMRTERLIRAHWTAAAKGDVPATESIRRLLERQARLLGLDKPVRFEVTDAMDAEIEGLLEEMGRLEREAATTIKEEVHDDAEAQEQEAQHDPAG